MKGLFCMLIGIFTGSPTLYLDGEESPIEETKLTNAKSEPSTVQPHSQNEDTTGSKDNSNSSKDFSSDSENKSSSSKEESSVINESSMATIDRPRDISEMFQKMYLGMHNHENTLLTNEKNEYLKTGEVPADEDNYHAQMADMRKNDHVNLTNQLKSFTKGSEEFSGESENKRDLEDSRDDNVKNKIQKK